MQSQKRFSQASLLISTKYFQNRIIMLCLELQYYTVFCREVQYYRCSRSAVTIGNNIFPIGIMKLQQYRRFIFPDQNYKGQPLEFGTSFPEIYIYINLQHRDFYVFKNERYFVLTSCIIMIRPGVMVAMLCQQLSSLGRSSYLARLCYTGKSFLTWLVFVIQVDPF